MKYLVFIACLFVCSCTNTPEEKKYDAYHRLRESVRVCIDQHVYLYTQVGYTYLYIPLFGEDDKPERCDIGIETKPAEKLDACGTTKEQSECWRSACAAGYRYMKNQELEKDQEKLAD